MTRMNRISLASLLLCLAFSGQVFSQGLSAVLNDDGMIVVSGDNISLVGFELQSSDGLLVPVPNNNPQPFQLLLANNEKQIAYAAPSEPVLLTGDLVLGAGYDGSPEQFYADIVGEWGGLTENVGGQINLSPVTSAPASDAGSLPEVTPDITPSVPDSMSDILPEPTSFTILFGFIICGLLPLCRER